MGNEGADRGGRLSPRGLPGRGSLHLLDRRTVVLGGCGAIGAGLGLCFSPLRAEERSAAFDAALKATLAGRTPVPGPILFDLPEIAENGNTVPFVANVDSPMTDADHVKAITILSSMNPQPVIARFGFEPASGKASVTGRMRLARTQEVFALAELSDGRVLMAATTVKVTIGGCGG